MPRSTQSYFTTFLGRAAVTGYVTQEGRQTKKKTTYGYMSAGGSHLLAFGKFCPRHTTIASPHCSPAARTATTGGHRKVFHRFLTGAIICRSPKYEQNQGRDCITVYTPNRSLNFFVFTRRQGESGGSSVSNCQSTSATLSSPAKKWRNSRK